MEYKDYASTAASTSVTHFLDSLKGGIISHVTRNLQCLAKCLAKGRNFVEA